MTSAAWTPSGAVEVDDKGGRSVPVLKYQSATVARRRGAGSRREIWQAETLDGDWIIDRSEEPGTPWLVFYRPDPTRSESDLLAGEWPTLKAARAAIASGYCQQVITARQTARLLALVLRRGIR